MKTHIIVILLSTILLTQSFGQATEDTTSISKNTVYLELLGNGGFYSFNYDRILFSKNLFKIAGRVGIAFFPPPISYNDVFIYPAELDFFYGKKHNLELGIAYTQVIRLYSEDLLKIYDSYSVYGVRAGYRYQKPKGGLFFKTGILCSNIPGNNFSRGFSLWIGLGLGYTFKNK